MNRRKFNIKNLLILGAIASFIGVNSLNAQNGSFKEVSKEFPRQEKNLRKWDSPVVADLDKDGYPDLLINDHGYAIQVQWNNKGKFAKPFDIIMGDLHGVSVGDFDNDGNLEIIMSRGGGSGSNARNSKMYKVNGREFIPMTDFEVPLALMRGRTVKFADLDNDGDLDLLNFAFPDGAKKGASENYVYENNGAGELILHSTLPASKVNGQKTLITDINNDNIIDIILYGDKNVIVYQGNGDLTFTDVTKKVLPYDIDEVTAIAEIDFDNDGDMDLFFTRGLEFTKGETFYNKETQDLGFFSKRGELEIDDFVSGEVLKLENFQSQWPNNDTYYIGEASYDYVFDGETHSGKDINLVMSDALGFPDNTGFSAKKGWYIGYVGNQKWRIAGYLWAPATGVVHNVKNYTESKHPAGLNDILLENKGSKFVDVTKKANVFLEEHTMAVTVADYDNNGFDDLLVIRRGKLVYENESILYLNNGNSGFKSKAGHNIITKDLGGIGMTVESIDYNKDGNVDVVIGDERGKWHLYKNEMADGNKSLTVEVKNSKKGNISPLGALVTISSCGNNQIQRVGTSASQYSLNHNTFVYFGLGDCSKSVKVKVTYSNGEVLEQTVKATNTAVVIGK
ncbi:CRTAC1 family protein [Polaribacter undariae]|uniref:CRTAC1 family protein n=1 Tax=Polaribacter sejongensis TaxID=985043 RepID=A0AAJ1QXP9_9FLAO|nr:CRTAC1 family protein [Polaribacter undariae]MDN3620025.1 CRTAC1 family protein [Polaribacter undariae]UWD31785.1 CRTAC1 family protein [Polaribacter undariae]